MGFSGGKKRLGFFLCWAIVFADIGTSIYYVPGILYEEVGSRASAFVLLTGVAFIFLAIKYSEIASRYREGGGVVAVAGEAFGPYFGALGGILISVDYFLTSAISSVSGLQYLAAIVPLGKLLLPAVVAALLFLGILNAVGIRESAAVTLPMALAALLIDLIVMIVVGAQLKASDWSAIFNHMVNFKGLGLSGGLVGFAGAWLAFSGLESISQIAPAMRSPRERTSRVTMSLVVGSILLTSPFLTAFATVLSPVNKNNSERFISELSIAYGGQALQVAVVITASVLLLFAANTAIIGGYHVFRAMTAQGFLPEFMGRMSPYFGTPQIAIAIAVIVPSAVIIATGGDLSLLGQLYAFGLLGAFTLSSTGLDVVRYREGRRGFGFVVGLFTSLAVLVAWLTNIVAKPLSTLFGGTLTFVGMFIAVGVRRNWFRPFSIPVPYVSRGMAEQSAADLPEAAKILTLGEARDLQSIYKAETMLCLRGIAVDEITENTVKRIKERDEQQIYVLFVDEVPGFFFPGDIGPSDSANATLSRASKLLEQHGIMALPLWRVGHHAGETIAHTVAQLNIRHVLVGASRRTPIWKLLRGSVIRELSQRLPDSAQLQIVR